jgi:FKBP-type peptidyl-prolyl cis-trans isomerase (trigger factor)
MKFETKIEKKDKGIIAVSVTMPFAEVEKNRETVIDRMIENIEIEGFRKGKAPRETAIAKVGEGKIMQEASQETINQVFPEMLKKEKIQIIGYPSISVTKLTAGNDFEFTVEMAVYPEVTLPDYKKIAKAIKIDAVKNIDDTEVAKVEKNLLDMQNHMSHQNHDHKEGEKCEQAEVTELTDDFVKQLGPFENVSDFKKKLQEDLEKEAEDQVVSKHRGDIAEAILKELTLDLPELLVNAELDKITAQMQDDMQRQGQDFDEFLKKEGKNKEEFRESHRTEGDKRAKIEVVLKEIFKDAKLKIDVAESAKQVETITQAHGEENLENIKLYVENIMINDEVMKYLTELSK